MTQRRRLIAASLGASVLLLISSTAVAAAGSTLPVSVAVADVERQLVPTSSLLAQMKSTSVSLVVDGNPVADGAVVSDELMVRSSTVVQAAIVASHHGARVDASFVATEVGTLGTAAAHAALVDQSLSYAAASVMLADLATSRRIAVTITYARRYASSLYTAWQHEGRPRLFLPSGAPVTSANARSSFESASAIRTQRQQINMAKAESYLDLHAGSAKGASLRSIVQSWMSARIAAGAVQLFEKPPDLVASNLPNLLPSSIG